MYSLMQLRVAHKRQWILMDTITCLPLLIPLRYPTAISSPQSNGIFRLSEQQAYYPIIAHSVIGDMVFSYY